MKKHHIHVGEKKNKKKILCFIIISKLQRIKAELSQCTLGNYYIQGLHQDHLSKAIQSSTRLLKQLQ